MSSQIITVTVQGVLFSALSTILAQSITAWREQKFTVDVSSFFMFMLIAIVMTPPNYLYQKYLEDSFPARIPLDSDPKTSDGRGGGGEVVPKYGRDRLSKTNTVVKFCLDQSLGAMANTAGFILLVGLLRGKEWGLVVSELNQNFWSMLTASWRVWPMVTLLNLVVVPFDYRMVVGNIVGVCWGVYVTLQQM